MMLRVSTLRLAGAALLFAAAIPAAAQTGGTPEATQAASAPSDQASVTAAAPTEAARPQPPKEERKICRMVDGSEARLGAKRMCLTAEQWKHVETE